MSKVGVYVSAVKKLVINKLRESSRYQGAEPELPLHALQQFPRETEGATSPGAGGLTVYCFGQITVVDPYGNELNSREWSGSKSAPSGQKLIVIELVYAKIKRQIVSKMKLLSILFPEIWNEPQSEKVLTKFNQLLSLRLSQLKETFAPYQIFEKINDGYRLHPTVHIDLFEKREIQKRDKKQEGEKVTSFARQNE